MNRFEQLCKLVLNEASDVEEIADLKKGDLGVAPSPSDTEGPPPEILAKADSILAANEESAGGLKNPLGRYKLILTKLGYPEYAAKLTVADIPKSLTKGIDASADDSIIRNATEDDLQGQVGQAFDAEMKMRQIETDDEGGSDNGDNLEDIFKY